MIGFTHYLPTKLLFGEGQLRRLGRQALPGKRALVVTSPGQVKRGEALAETLAQLEKAGVSASVFDGVSPNPTAAQAAQAAEQCRAEGCGFLVGLGGGSSIDTAKAAGLLRTNGGQWRDYGDRKPFSQPGLPVVAIPTAAGSGAEVSPWAVITDEESGLKAGLGRLDGAPVLAVVDPSLTLSMPLRQTAYQGFDALFHAIETVINKNSDPMSEMYALKAVELLAQGLPAVLEEGSDLEARAQVSLGAVLAGIGMRSCSAHALEHALSGRHPSLPHGAGLLALALPYYQHFADRHACDGAFAKLDTALNRGHFPKALSRLMDQCGMGEIRLSEYGVTPEELPALAAEAKETAPYLFFNDPAPLSDEEAVAILRAAYR